MSAGIGHAGAAVTADSGAPPCLSSSGLRRSQSFGRHATGLQAGSPRSAQIAATSSSQPHGALTTPPSAPVNSVGELSEKSGAPNSTSRLPSPPTPSTLPTLEDSLEQLRKYIESSGYKKIASTGIGTFYKAAGRENFKTVFQKAGGLKKALEHTDKLVYVTSEKNPLQGTIEVRSPPTATVTAKGKATANLNGSEGGPQAGTPSSLQSPTNPPPTLQFNSVRLPLRPGAKICMHWHKNRRCDLGGKCKFDHPDEVNELPTDGVVLSTSKDKKNCTIGFIALDEGNYESDEQSRAKVYFFHGEPPKHGFKVLGTGVLQSAGLELIKGDKVAELVLKGAKTSQGYQVVAGSLV